MDVPVDRTVLAALVEIAETFVSDALEALGEDGPRYERALAQGRAVLQATATRARAVALAEAIVGPTVTLRAAGGRFRELPLWAWLAPLRPGEIVERLTDDPAETLRLLAAQVDLLCRTGDHHQTHGVVGVERVGVDHHADGIGHAAPPDTGASIAPTGAPRD
ncbi:MAG TPA: hypothetical protein VM434_12965 [Beijerinckiaceae bacterium]|nr:hypothetical protein [Beijerinckiaceae bacterium]